MQNIFIGRQPIYNTQLGVFGYELLFRDGTGNAALVDSEAADRATSATIVNSFIEFGLERLVGQSFAFINLTEKFLLEEDALPIAPGQVVLEVLEDVPVNDELIQAVKRLSSAGFTIALDDYIYNPAHKPLIAIADIIKIDIMQLDRDELKQHVEILGEYKAKLLAEKVETLDEFEYCKSLGFDYFQGYFLSRPRIIKGKTLPTNKLAALSLLAIMQNPSAETSELEKAIISDVSLSYKLLKCINSALYGLPRTIESIRQAIVLMGRKQLSSVASMLALAKTDDLPREMVLLTLVRAKMCELLAVASSLKSPETYFTAGLISAIDIIMERELPELIKPLPLSEEIVDALLQYKGDVGEALACVLAYEVSDFDKAVFQQLEAKDILVANVEAISWANTIIDSL